MNDMTIEGLPVAPFDHDTYLSLEPMVNDVAGREWHNSRIYTIDDVAQAIWEHLMAKWSEYKSKDEALIRWGARRAARTWCQEERVKHMYATGAYVYTPAMIRRHLEESVWCDGPDSQDLEARCDISEAFAYLTKGQKAVLYKRYALKEPLNGTETTAASRAVASLTNRLNTGLRLQPESPEGYYQNGNSDDDEH